MPNATVISALRRQNLPDRIHGHFRLGGDLPQRSSLLVQVHHLGDSL